MVDSLDELLAEIDAFLAETNMTQTDFGVEVMNNRSFVRQLREGGGVTVRTADKVRRYICEERARLARNAADRKRYRRQKRRSEAGMAG